jgi:hypothetical protein
MKKLLYVSWLVALLLPACALAQNAFEGTWKIDLSKAHMPTKPDVYLLQNGMYDCKTCVPAISIKADGMDHAVTGHPYYDMMAVQVVDDHTVKTTEKKSGKVVATSTTTVAPDGKTATVVFNDSSDSNAAPVTGQVTNTRVAKGPAGSHAISGSWRTSSLQTVSDNGLSFTYKADGDSLSMTTPTGQSYTAKLDGSDAPYNGDPGTTSVSLKKLGANSVQETDKRNGKVIGVSTMTVAADGKSMKIDVKDVLHGTTSSFVADKQ